MFQYLQRVNNWLYPKDHLLWNHMTAITHVFVFVGTLQMTSRFVTNWYIRARPCVSRTNNIKSIRNDRHFANDIFELIFLCKNVIWIKFYWNASQRVEWTLGQHQFRQWLGADNCEPLMASFIDLHMRHSVSMYLYSGLILGLCPANERRSYFGTTSLIGWAQK